MLRANPEILNPKTPWDCLSEIEQYLIDQALDNMKKAGFDFGLEADPSIDRHAERIALLKEFPDMPKELLQASQDPNNALYIPSVEALLDKKRYDGTVITDPTRQIGTGY